MLKRSGLLAIALFAALSVTLSGCGGSDSASYMIDEKSDNAFSLFRDRLYSGADWDISFAVTHLPDCQRRHTLKAVGSDRPYKAELFLIGDGDYLLRSGNAWYEAQLGNCSLQAMESSPASPGDLVGSWEERDGKLKFYPSSKQ